MNVYEIDNSIEKDLDGTITWQYDNATNLIALISTLKDFCNQAVENFWDSWSENVVDIDSADDFGLAVWGKLLNVPRPNVTIGEDTDTMSTELYRKILKARFTLINSTGTIPDYVKYIESVFDGECTVTDNGDMSMTFTLTDDVDEELAAVAEQSPDIVFVYPAGVHDGSDTDSIIFGLDGQLEVEDDDPPIGGLDESSFNWRQQ